MEMKGQFVLQKPPLGGFRRPIVRGAGRENVLDIAEFRGAGGWYRSILLRR